MSSVVSSLLKKECLDFLPYLVIFVRLRLHDDVVIVYPSVANHAVSLAHVQLLYLLSVIVILGEKVCLHIAKQQRIFRLTAGIDGKKPPPRSPFGGVPHCLCPSAQRDWSTPPKGERGGGWGWGEAKHGQEVCVHLHGPLGAVVGYLRDVLHIVQHLQLLHKGGPHHLMVHSYAVAEGIGILRHIVDAVPLREFNSKGQHGEADANEDLAERHLQDDEQAATSGGDLVALAYYRAQVCLDHPSCRQDGERCRQQEHQQTDAQFYAESPGHVHREDFIELPDEGDAIVGQEGSE